MTLLKIYFIYLSSASTLGTYILCMIEFRKYLFYITVLSEVFLFLYMIYPVVMVMCVGHKFLA